MTMFGHAPREPPEPADPGWIRVSSAPLPTYAFVPGRAPHPRRHPDGHSYGRPEPKAAPIAPLRWWESPLYLYALDLYNLGYFWECHEALEALWHAAGRETLEGRFFQGIIQIAAANLKWHLEANGAARELTRRALSRLDDAPADYMGLDVAAFRDEARARAAGERDRPAVLRLTTEAAGRLHAPAQP